jgi:hypothetical protein
MFLNNNINNPVYINMPSSWAETYILVNLIEIIYKFLKKII